MISNLDLALFCEIYMKKSNFLLGICNLKMIIFFKPASFFYLF